MPATSAETSADLSHRQFNLIGIGGAGGIIGGIDGNIVLTSLAKLGLEPLGTTAGRPKRSRSYPGSLAIGAAPPSAASPPTSGASPLTPLPTSAPFNAQSGSLIVSSISTGEPSDLNLPVASVTVILNEPAGVGFFSTSALTLTVTRHQPDHERLSPSRSSPARHTDQRPFQPDLRTEGTYTLTVNAADIHDVYGNPGTGSVATSWVMDTTPPTSTSTLCRPDHFHQLRRLRDRLRPKAANGSAASGVASIAIYDSTNGGSFALFTTVSPSDPSATFVGEPAIPTPSTASRPTMRVTCSPRPPRPSRRSRS